MQRLLSPARLRAIQELQAAKPSREALEALTLDATRTLAVPRSQINIVTGDHQYTLAISGVDNTGATMINGAYVIPLNAGICWHIVDTDQPLAIDDTMGWEVTKNLGCVVDDGIRAYLGHPMTSYTGEAIGSFCVIDYRPRRWTQRDKIMLASYASSANLILLQALLAS